MKNHHHLHNERKLRDAWESFLIEELDDYSGHDELVRGGYMCHGCFSAFSTLCQFERYHHQKCKMLVITFAE